jgi:anti-sigma factor RsiW
MGCPEREAKLTDWILDELAPAEARELEQHLEHCGDCSHSADRLRELRGALMKNLTDREMPAHLVFVNDKPKNQWAGFLNSLWRTATLAAAAAAVFLAILVGAAAHWQNRLAAAMSAVSARPAGRAQLSEADVKALATQEVERQMALERRVVEEENRKLAVSLRDDQMKNLDRLARQVDYVQSVESTVWKQTQQQGAMVALIARNSMEPKVPAPGKR